MGDRTGIAWTDASWNPVRGCTRVSPGCVHCYAETVAARFSGPGQPYQGLAQWVTRPGGEREARWTGKLAFVETMLDQPLRWRRPRRIFVNSMSDLFHEAMPDEWIDRVFAIMALAPQHVFQVLTKRPERARAYLASLPATGAPDRLTRIAARIGAETRGYRGSAGLVDRPLPNVWLGVSVEDQARADERIPILLDTPAAVRWISAEPLLGPLDLDRWLPYSQHWRQAEPSRASLGLPCLEWVVIGGESGPGARPFTLGWGKDLIRQCRAGSAAVFMKQVGSVPVNREGERCPHIRDLKGGDPAEWPEELRVREWPR